MFIIQYLNEFWQFLLDKEWWCMWEIAAITYEELVVYTSIVNEPRNFFFLQITDHHSPISGRCDSFRVWGGVLIKQMMENLKEKRHWF